MAEPTRKDPEIDRVLESISGRSRVDSIKGNVCSWCGGPAIEFKDALSEKEYRISGFCQKCQDETFGG